MNTQDQHLESAPKAGTRQPDSLKRRTDAIGGLLSTIARSLSVKPVSDLLLHDRSAGGLEITCARESSAHGRYEWHFIFLIPKS